MRTFRMAQSEAIKLLRDIYQSMRRILVRTIPSVAPCLQHFRLALQWPQSSPLTGRLIVLI
jgi:hypothetical protein